ncbi:MAG TPA: site-2 protease family protein [Candidatus Paceibacterota bacterium]|nr:site-2 protease family protein [Candidatus Paceibacterota bacterium]
MVSAIIIFIIVLVALIVVHEFGHFVAAKLSGMRVDEFGIGYPPKAAGRKWHGTEYTLNWLPFGGFVRIYGEDQQAVDEDPQDAERAFFKKPRILQALVLGAGILMNLLFAWLLLSLTLGLGATRALEESEIGNANDPYVLVSSVMPGSPAEEAGFMPGDRIVRATAGADLFLSASADEFTSFVSGETDPITFVVENQDAERTLTATPRAGLSPEDPERKVLGVGVASVGIVKTPWHVAPVEGLTLTWELTKATAVGLVQFFGSIFTLSADLSQVSGPVGIAGAVGDAAGTGLSELLTLTAIISINLALINLLPIPALDGGRLLFVAIEAVIRRPLPRKFQAWVNAAGFAFLILLMIVVTASDLFKIAG